jgi:hypothetical protein
MARSGSRKLISWSGGVAASPVSANASRLLMLLDTIQVGFRTERIVFVGDIGSIVGSMQYLVLLALFPLGRFFALLVLASQFLLPLLERCA